MDVNAVKPEAVNAEEEGEIAELGAAPAATEKPTDRAVAPAPVPSPSPPVSVTAPLQQEFDVEGWERLQQQAEVLLPATGRQGITPSLFLTFWSLSLYDLDVPTARYESVLNQLRSAARIARDDIEAARRDVQREAQRGFAPGFMSGGGFGGGR
jgi:hypothetical protein